MFVVMYRWRLKEEAVETFREGWRRMTEAIYRTRGSLGSRLHRADDGTWVALAQWPSRADWERAGRLEPADPEALAMMREAVAERLPMVCLEPTDDLLRPAPAKRP